jgi:hypothetical protein
LLHIAGFESVTDSVCKKLQPAPDFGHWSYINA